MNVLKTQVCIDYAKIWRQMVANLVGRSTDKLTLTSQHFKEETMLATLTEAGNQAALSSLHLAKTNLLYLYKEYTEAIAQAEITERYIGSVRGTINVSVHSFYYMLALLGHYPQATDEEQGLTLQIVELRQQHMEKLAQTAPMNFLHKYELVEAEKARVLRQNDRAMEFYDRAIQSAKTYGFIQEEALTFFCHSGQSIIKTKLSTQDIGYG